MFKKIALSALIMTGVLYASGYNFGQLKEGMRGWSAQHAHSTLGRPDSDWGAR